MNHPVAELVLAGLHGGKEVFAEFSGNSSVNLIAGDIMKISGVVP